MRTVRLNHNGNSYDRSASVGCESKALATKTNLLGDDPHKYGGEERIRQRAISPSGIEDVWRN